MDGLESFGNATVGSGGGSIRPRSRAAGDIRPRSRAAGDIRPRSGNGVWRHGGGIGTSGFRVGLGRSRRASAAAPSSAPSWFGLLALRHPSDSSCRRDSFPPYSPTAARPWPS